MCPFKSVLSPHLPLAKATWVSVGLHWTADRLEVMENDIIVVGRWIYEWPEGI